jgi:hypothetical protein
VLIHKRCTSEILSPTTRQLAVVRVLPAWLIDPRPTVVCEVMQVSVDPYSFSSDLIESPPSFFFYPNLDLCASLTLMPLSELFHC